MRLVAAVLLTLAATALASQGDRSPAYQLCLGSCLDECPAPGTESAWSLWPCSAECAYTCTTYLTDFALSVPPDSPTTEPGDELDGLVAGRMVQFHGKWPFRRYLGMQEPLSVLFSLLNLAAHWAGLRKLGRIACHTRRGRTLQHDYRLNAFIGINTWVWSAAFHTRDVGWTEKADYFSAAASTLYGLWLVVDRLLLLYQPAQGGGVKRARTITQLICLAVLVSHCSYLSVGRFDYGYNMTFNLVVGVSQILLWIVWSFAPIADDLPTPEHQRQPLLPAVLILSSTSLELLDFQPVPSDLRLLDAHALWHASTILIIRQWYNFLEQDLLWVEERDESSKRLR